jgi:formylglycine-generating enzyme
MLTFFKYFVRHPLLPAALVIAGCSRPGSTDRSADTGPASSAPAAPVSGSVVGSSDPAPSAAPSGSARENEVLPGRTEGCPDGMVRVSGEYCPAVIENCAEHHPEYKRNGSDKNVSERCLRYEEPSKCLSKKRVTLDFCMDRYEFPNKKGELPRVLTSWVEAVELCKNEGKRLCTEDEFNFACEGPEMRPYVYGFVRDATKCNIDKEYRFPDHSRVLPTYDKCRDTPWCAAELERLDQRHKIGDLDSCVSWSGIYDLNGNVNEWVEIPNEKPPNRSGLKGGWWGPVRSRCRPTVTFHKESDYGYEQGLRCCASAK